jgi:hypothetical protein
VTGFWITTVLLAFGVGSDGAAEFAHLGNNGGLVHLGCPVSFVTLIGFSKVPGAVAGFSATARWKQWAHADIFCT